MRTYWFPVCLLLLGLVFLGLAQAPQTSINTSSANALGVDPCSDHSLSKVFVPINQAAAGPTTILAGVVSKRWYVCYLFLHNGTNATPVNVGMVEGTGANCSSVSAGLYGGATAATNPNLAGAEMQLMGNGATAVLLTATAGDNICYIASGTTQVAGVLVAVNK